MSSRKITRSFACSCLPKQYSDISFDGRAVLLLCAALTLEFIKLLYNIYFRLHPSFRIFKQSLREPEYDVPDVA
jgi:hypothetical protein